VYGADAGDVAGFGGKSLWLRFFASLGMTVGFKFLVSRCVGWRGTVTSDCALSFLSQQNWLLPKNKNCHPEQSEGSVFLLGCLTPRP